MANRYDQTTGLWKTNGHGRPGLMGANSSEPVAWVDPLADDDALNVVLLRRWTAGDSFDREVIGTMPAIIATNSDGQLVSAMLPNVRRESVNLCWDPSFATLYAKTKTWITDTGRAIPDESVLGILS